MIQNLLKIKLKLQARTTSMSQLIGAIYVGLSSRTRLKVRVTRLAFISKRKLFLNFDSTVLRNVPSIVSIILSVLDISYQLASLRIEVL